MTTHRLLWERTALLRPFFFFLDFSIFHSVKIPHRWSLHPWGFGGDARSSFFAVGAILFEPCGLFHSWPLLDRRHSLFERSLSSPFPSFLFLPLFYPFSYHWPSRRQTASLFTVSDFWNNQIHVSSSNFFFLRLDWPLRLLFGQSYKRFNAKRVPADLVS